MTDGEVEEFAGTLRGALRRPDDEARTIWNAMSDLSPMKSVRVEPDAKTARVEPGVVLNELDHETQQFGLATPVGYNSTTGIAGLTLGGGWRWLSRTYGLTVDNLLSADVVTTEGKLAQASEDEIEDLIATDDRVVVRYRFSGTHDGPVMDVPATGRHVETVGMAIFRIEDGQLVEEWAIDDIFGLLTQLGEISETNASIL